MTHTVWQNFISSPQRLWKQFTVVAISKPSIRRNEFRSFWQTSLNVIADILNAVTLPELEVDTVMGIAVYRGYGENLTVIPRVR